MTTTTITRVRTADLSPCPHWCRGEDQHSNDDGIEFHHGGPCWVLNVRGGLRDDEGHVTGDYQSIGVYLGQKVTPDATPTVSLSCRDDEDHQHSWLALTPKQAAELAGMLTPAVSAAL